jgi:hypothetical protein
MRLSFTTIYNVPDEYAQEFIMGLKMGMAPNLDPDILKTRTQTIETTADFIRPGSEEVVKLGIITIIEAGIEQ